jgi:hypothetical protein
LNNGAEITNSVSEQFASGSTINKDFSFSFTVQTSSVSTAVTSGGGGGGGGGGYVPPASTQLISVEAKKVDFNDDNKVDILDFNTLMVNWGGASLFDFNLLMINWTL